MHSEMKAARINAGKCPSLEIAIVRMHLAIKQGCLAKEGSLCALSGDGPPEVAPSSLPLKGDVLAESSPAFRRRSLSSASNPAGIMHADLALTLLVQRWHKKIGLQNARRQHSSAI